MNPNWKAYSEFPVHAPVAVKNDDGRWVYHHVDQDGPIETPCKNLERSMFWYHLTEIMEVPAEEVEAHMKEKQAPENVKDFIAVRIPVDELRENVFAGES